MLPIPTKLITIDTQGFTLSRVNNAASNNGTIEGGNGAAALNTTADITLTNSGIIRAGAGQANALQFGAARTTVLELQAGSVIQGNALAGATGTSDILRLGGTANDVFDISTVGATAQYRNFDIFQKTGTSTWALTGTGTATIDWDIQDGTLQVSSDGNLGDAAGGLTLAGGTLKTTPMGTGDSLMGRVGVAADYQDVLRVSVGKVLHRASLYGIANLYYELLDGTGVKVAGIKVRSADNRAAAGAGAGASYSWANDAYSVYGEVVAKTSLRNFGDSYDYTGTVGFRMKF